MSIDQAQLENLQQTLQSDGYSMDVDVQGENANVAIVAGPEACEECLVPKDLMRMMLEPALGVAADRITLVYPTDAVAS
jgi:hypothetical protein